MSSLSATVFNTEPANRCAEASENRNSTVWLPETAKPATATKAAAKDMNPRTDWRRCSRRENKTRRAE
jgi:hypothetical protein